MPTDVKGRTFEQVLEMVKSGVEAASSLVPFFVGASLIVRQVMEAWKIHGAGTEEVRAHIAASEADVRELVAWWSSYEPVKHPDSKL